MANRFALLGGSDDEDGAPKIQAKPAAKPAAAKPAAAAAPAKAAAAAPAKPAAGASAKPAGERPAGDKPRRAAGPPRPRSSAPRADGAPAVPPRTDGDFVAEGDSRGERHRQNMRAGRHPTEEQKDRHSNSAKPKGQRSKRDGAGHSNWGSDRDVIKDETQHKTEDAVAAELAEASAEGVEQAPEEPVVEQEPEDKTISLQEYLSKKSKPAVALPKARAANEGVDTKSFATHQLKAAAEEAEEEESEEAKEKRVQRANQKVHVDVNFRVAAPSSVAGNDEGRGRGRGRGRGGDRGGRGGDRGGRGGDRGGRGGDRGASRGGRPQSAGAPAHSHSGPAASFNITTDFPALGKN